MKILHKDLREGKFKLQIDNNDDVWLISQIVDSGDLVSGQTFRKIKIGDSENAESVKKKMYIEIEIDRVEFARNSKMLKLIGKVTQGPEDIPLGSFHSLNVDPDSTITIKKNEWMKFQLMRLDEAEKNTDRRVMLVACDRNHAIIAKMTGQGFEIISELKGDSQKKMMDEAKGKDFFFELISTISEYAKHHKISQIVIGTPDFWRKHIQEEIKDKELGNKIIFGLCYSVSNSGLNELLKRPEVKEALHKDRAIKEVEAVENLLTEISKEALAAYGFKQVKSAVENGAVKTLLITDEFMTKKREQNAFGEVDYLMRTADNMKADIIIISSEHEGGKKLDGLGGIGALLRYKIR